MSQISIVDASDLANRVATAGTKLVVVNFYATWCGPCKLINPAIEALTIVHPNTIFLKVDVDELEDIAQQYGISNMPTYIYIKNSTIVKEVYGANLVDFTLALEANQ
ncbi:MAG: thioredoxin family protein [Pseudomonas sp.]|uniref:thioredoxin family protein n=1 Tax=Pseudomonas sp. TaxID=306 RepID=UPI0027288B65|nr:thioredoxin family protein [Pseudomonas sp.]MDO9328066.1 thioredoxin family protein [Pseudomonas sp.]